MDDLFGIEWVMFGMLWFATIVASVVLCVLKAFGELEDWSWWVTTLGVWWVYGLMLIGAVCVWVADGVRWLVSSRNDG